MEYFREGFDWKDVWVAETRYKLNDLSTTSGQVYVCITGPTLSDGLEADARWQHFLKVLSTEKIGLLVQDIE